MKTIVNKNTGQLICATFSNFVNTETEIAIDEILTSNFVSPYFNFTTRLFYEGATQIEIDAFNAIKEDAEDLTDLQLLEAKGLDLYHRTKKRLIRRRKKGLITANQAKKVREILNPIFLFLKTGDLDIALDKANLLAIDANANVQAELVWFKERLTEIQ